MNTDKHRYLLKRITKEKSFGIFRFFHRCSSVRRSWFIASARVFICGKNRFALFVLLSVVALSLVSCAEVAKDMGLDQVSDIEQRAGLDGTKDNPGVLDPFKTYNLVMAANECRYFSMKIPENWYWKLYFTAANPDATQAGHVEAEIESASPAWVALPDADLKKSFSLMHEGSQAVLGVGNNEATRVALLRLCQDGAPLHITLKSQVSSNSELLGPHSKDKK